MPTNPLDFQKSLYVATAVASPVTAADESVSWKTKIDATFIADKMLDVSKDPITSARVVYPVGSFEF